MRPILAKCAVLVTAWSIAAAVHAASADVQYTGVADDVSTPFGGPPYCSFRVAMSNLAVNVVISGTLVKSAIVTGTMTETAVGSCPFPTFGTVPNSWSTASGAVSGTALNLSLAGAASNVPGSVATFAGALNGNQLTGTLTIRRTDQVGNLAWVLTTPVTALATRPPFDLTVTSSITATTASATAQITFPPTDVGRSASIFVFAYAPRSIVKAAGIGKDGVDAACVLAQPDPATGQLVQASAATLRPYLSGVVLGQSQAVTVLSNASTPANAGATYFVGYGADSASMISAGVDRSAVTIPGPVRCPQQLPSSADSLTGLWWNAGESGWGIHFTQRGIHLFAAWFTYDGTGNPKWYVASDCRMASAHQTSGRCAGDVYEFAGSRFFGATYDPAAVHGKSVGSLQVDFGDASHATMAYNVAGVGRTVTLSRMAFGSGAASATVDYTDQWWNPAESGWGLAVTHQPGVMFLAWFVYDDAGKPLWYVASNCVVSGQGCTGDVFRVSGPPFGPAFDPSAVHAVAMGSATLVFTGPNDGVFSYTINGVRASKTITRLLF